MAKHLDLEEQEQLDELKHFWKQYGNLITWSLIAVLSAFAAWNGFQYWQRTQSAQSAVMFDEIERAVQSGDTARTERALADMKDRFGGTVYAHQAGLLVAKAHMEKGNSEAARTALAWVAEKATEPGYQATAKLRLAGILIEKKSYDEAIQQLSGSFPKGFEGLVADRRGDILMMQGKKADAKTEYEKAWKALDERSDYRRLVEVKLNALGVDPMAEKVTVATTEDLKAVK